MKYMELDTPALIIDKNIMMDNIKFMQEYADRNNVSLRPHTKTHKSPKLAILQEQMGARGITVAKVGEAEIMAENGIKDIFIANEIVGDIKLKRIAKLMEEGINISFGLDSIEQANMVEKIFNEKKLKAKILIEIEVGENRSGVIEKDYFKKLLTHIKENCPHIYFEGIFSHDGNSYTSKDVKECEEIHIASQKRTLEFAEIAKELNMKANTVSIGSTPSLMHNFSILSGVTELRPGTYILMDASQANACQSHKRCAATILATVMSKPTDERIILDVGAKGITMQTRSKGICAVNGMGYIKQFPDAVIYDVYDEHAIIYNKDMSSKVNIGDKVEIVPVHICPVMNLHEKAYMVDNGEIIEEISILCRGKLQ